VQNSSAAAAISGLIIYATAFVSSAAAAFSLSERAQQPVKRGCARLPSCAAPYQPISGKNKETKQMRNIPVDTDRLNLIATGKISPKAQYATLSDGSSRRTGNQATTDDGIPLWVVDCLVDDDDAARAEVLGVTVAAVDEPQVGKLKAVRFRGVTAMVYRDNMTGQPKVSIKAEGIDGGQVKSVPAAS
jgi:hypothetical protein